MSDKYRAMKSIHVEPTNRCTLGCPECDRTLRPVTEIQDLDIDIIAGLCQHFDRVSFSGSQGDPIYHPQFHDMIRRVRTLQPEIVIRIITNGSFRNRDWWIETAGLLTARDEITFSIDGLPENNHIYRVRSRWDLLEQGIRALRENNDQVQLLWKWIIFKHNQQDLKAGRELATALGFDRIQFQWSPRYNKERAYLTPDRDFNSLMAELHEPG